MNTELTNLAADLPARRISALEQAGGLLLALVLTATASLAAWLRRGRRAWLAVSAVTLAGAGGLGWIFRHPRRSPPASVDAVLAACDGRVTAIFSEPEPRFLRSPSICVQITTAPTQVQVNWAPGCGVVAYRRYEPGFQQTGAAADDSSWLGIERADGRRLLLRQVASKVWRVVPWFLARRIICWPELADHVASGEVIGHLPLGGTVQVYLPQAAVLKVHRGQRVRGGETVLALLPAAQGRS